MNGISSKGTNPANLTELTEQLEKQTKELEAHLATKKTNEAVQRCLSEKSEKYMDGRKCADQILQRLTPPRFRNNPDPNHDKPETREKALIALENFCGVVRTYRNRFS